MNKLGLLLLVVYLGQTYCVLNPKVVCYYDYWFVWRTGKDKVTVANIDSTLCTHIVYASVRITSYGEIDYPDYDLMVGSGHDLQKFADAKGNGKALVSILETNLNTVASYEQSRHTLVANIIKMLETYRLDGIVLEWVTNAYSDAYVNLLHEIRVQFGTKYTLGVTVPANPGTYKAANVNSYVDFFSIQTYDYHGTWEMIVGFEAPMDMVAETLKNWVNAGAEGAKMLATIPMFGRTWILAGTDTAPGAKAMSAGRQGPWTQTEGKLSYVELCMMMEASPAEWEVHPDNSVNAMYAINKVTHTWVTFEAPLTAKAKTNNVTTTGYGGVVAVYMENDDYGNYCNQGKFPILTYINQGLDKNPVTLPPVTTPLTTPHVTVTVPPNQICQKTGIVRDPKDCNIYHKCTEFMPGILSDEVQHCDKGQAFDEKDGTCKDHTLVPGC